jgi:6-phosphofructokinase 1
MKAADLPAWLDADARQRLGTDDDRYDLTPLVLDTIASLRLDALITIGGDDTLSFARVLVDLGVPVLAIPKTMDNDVQGTDYAIGFSSAVTRGKELINRQRTTLGSHERIGVFRIFGRDAGFSALYTAYVTSTRCVIPEAPYDLDRLADILAEDHRANPSHYALVITSEGAIWQGAHIADQGEADSFGHRHKANVGEALAFELKARTGIDSVASELTYDLRSGEPDSLDSMVAITFANVAMDLLADGVVGRMVAIRDGKYAHVPVPDPSLPKRRVDVGENYNVERFRPRYDGRIGEPMLLLGAPLLEMVGRATPG